MFKKNQLTLKKSFTYLISLALLIIGLCSAACSKEQTAVSKPKPKSVNQVVYQVKSHDTLSKIFFEEDIPAALLDKIIYNPFVFNHLQPIKPHEKIVFHFEMQHQLKSLDIPLSQGTLTIHVDKKQIDATVKQKNTLVKTISVHGKIEGTLYQSLKRQGLSAKLIMQYIHVFSEDFNLAKSLKNQAKFSLIYEATYHNHKLQSTKLLAGTLQIKGHLQYAIFDKGEYYHANGENYAIAFLRTPVKYVYISSPFSKRRYHPILHIYRAHTGVDLAADKGTPVYAASKGKITYAGRMHGYGNIIILKYNSEYSTRYAHLNRFAKGIHRGVYVKEHQLIGYVGETGLATGPHLHYEFRIHDKAVNPMTVRLPHQPGLTGNQKKDFENYVAHLAKK